MSDKIIIYAFNNKLFLITKYIIIFCSSKNTRFIKNSNNLSRHRIKRSLLDLLMYKINKPNCFLLQLQLYKTIYYFLIVRNNK